MKPLLLALGVMALGATQTMAAPTRTSDNTARIAVQDGRTCYMNQCINLDLERGTVMAIGRYPARIPDGIDVRSGSVSKAEFRALNQAAGLAYAQGSGRR